MSKKRRKCKCGNREDGAPLYKCRSCQEISCEICGGDSSVKSCRECGHSDDWLNYWYKAVGYIDRSKD